MSGSTSFQDGFDTQLQQIFSPLSTDTEQEAHYTPIKDTTSVSQALPSQMGEKYAAPSNFPQLKQSFLKDSDTSGLDQMQRLLQTNPDQILSQMDALPVPKAKFEDQVENLLRGLSEADLASLGHHVPFLRRKAQLRFAILNPGLNYPPALREMANSLREQIRQAAGEPSEVFKDIVNAGTQTGIDAFFQTALIQEGLSLEDEKQVLFAYYSPEAAAVLPEKLKIALKQAQNIGLEKAQETLGFPEDWPVDPDGKPLFKRINDQVTSDIENSLSEQLSNGEISKAQYNEMRTLLFFPDTQTPNAGTYRPLIQKMQSKAIDQAQKDFGFPDSYEPTIQGQEYQDMLHGAYNAQLDKQLKRRKMTANQQKVIKNALLADSPEGLPENMQSLFKKVRTDTLDQLKKVYSLSDDWKANPELLAPIAINASQPKFVTAQTAIDQGKEWIQNAQKLLNEMGNTVPPEPVVLIKNYISSVSFALIKAQEMLYSLELTQSDLAEKMNKIQHDATIAKIAKQKEQIDEVLKQQKKMAALGPFKAFMQWITNILIILLTGPVGLILLTNMLVQGAKTGNFKDLSVIKAVADTMKDIGKAIGGTAGNAFARAATIISEYAIAILCPIALVLDLMLGDASFVRGPLEAFGVPKKYLDIVTMSIQIAAQVVGAIVMIVLSGGSAAPAMGAQLAKTLGTVAIRVVEFVEKVFDVFRQAFEAICEALGVSTTAPSAAANSIRTALEAFVQEADEAIETLTTKLDKLGDLEQAKDKAEEILNQAEEALQNAQKDSSTSAKTLSKLSETADAAKESFDSLNESFEALNEEVTKASEFSTKAFRAVTITAQGIPSMIQGSIQAATSFIQAIISRIRGDMDKMIAVVEQFVKLLQDLIAKLLENVKGVAQDIKGVGTMQADVLSKASQTLQNLFQNTTM